jgi:hypothetical protein
VVSFMKYIATNATMKKCHSRALRHFWKSFKAQKVRR